MSRYQLIVIPPLSILISMTFLLSILVEKLIGTKSVSIVSQVHCLTPCLWFVLQSEKRRNDDDAAGADGNDHNVFSFVEVWMSSCYKIVVSFCLPNDRREVGEREFGEWNNNHGVFLSVKVLSFVLVKSCRSPLLLTISGRFWIIPVFCDQLFQKTWKNWRGSEPSSSYERRTIPNDPGTLLISETEKRFDEDAAVVNFDDHGECSLVRGLMFFLNFQRKMARM